VPVEAELRGAAGLLCLRCGDDDSLASVVLELLLNGGRRSACCESSRLWGLRCCLAGWQGPREWFFLAA